MIDFSGSPFPVRPDIEDRLDATWSHLAGPGTWFTGRERLQMAHRARLARSGADLEPTGEPTDDIVERIAARPATTNREWIETMVSSLGNEERYVEAMGIAARVVMADTFARLIGVTPFALPPPRPGKPTMQQVEPRPKRIRSWISVGSALIPPFTQALVPHENAMTYPLIETLYMTGEDMTDPDFRRGGLHRTQIELVASVLSYGNECFY